MSPAPGSPIEVVTLERSAAHRWLAIRLGATAPGAAIRRTDTGKPYLDGGPHFNLSHSADLAVVAICADTPVGVDLERVRPLRNGEALARRMCTPAELAWLQERPPAGRDAARLWLWVRKEAVAKAEGGGIATALGGLDVLATGVRTPSGADFAVLDLPAPAPGFLAALAWREPDRADRL